MMARLGRARGLTRRRFLAAAGGAAAAASALGCHGLAAAKRPLNLLFLMTDQHHHGVLGGAGNPLVKTPNLDRLAAGGVRFTHACCPVPFCSPTRAAIATGRYPSTLGIWRNIRDKDDPARLREPQRIYLHQLAARGYRCHQLGKWHLGHPQELSCFAEGRQDAEAPPQLVQARRKARGQAIYDHGVREGEERVGQICMTHAIAAKHRIWKEEKRRSPQDLSVVGRSRIKPEFHYESILADYCVGLLRRYRDEPFAITWSVSPPHAWWIAPAPYYDLYDPAAFELPASWRDRPERWATSQPARMGALFGEEGIREYLRCYYAQVTMMDWCLGRILDELDRLGLADRTLVVFTSDHGDMQGAHGMMGKSMPGFYDEIVRVPLLMRLPGLIPRGATADGLASSVDLAPTILDLLGAEPLERMHGRSLRRVIDGEPDDGRPAVAERGDPEGNCARMIRTREWKLVRRSSPYQELFHLTDDPRETRDLAHRPDLDAVRRDLAGKLRNHMERIGDPALPTLFGQG